MQPRLVDSSPMVVSCDRAHSECAAAEQVQVVVHVPAAALSRPRLAPGTSRSSIMQPRFVASFAIVVSFRYAGRRDVRRRCAYRRRGYIAPRADASLETQTICTDIIISPSGYNNLP